MVRRFLVLVLLLSTAILASTGCSPRRHAVERDHRTAAMPLDPVPIVERATPALPVTVRGFDGAQVTVTDASRILAIDRNGTITQIVYALGLGDRLVGRSSAGGFPAVAKLPNVGRGGVMDVEGVIALHPSILLTDSATATPAMDRQLRSAGVRLVYFDPERTLSNVSAHIRAVANALGVAAQGVALAQRTEREIAAATTAPIPAKKPRIAFLYLRSTAITMLAGPGSGADALIEALGGVNAGTAAGLHHQFEPITRETMAAAAPDLFLVMTDGLNSIGGEIGLLKLPGVAETPAGRHGRIVDMADTVVLGFGPNTGRILTALHTAIYRTHS